MALSETDVESEGSTGHASRQAQSISSAEAREFRRLVYPDGKVPKGYRLATVAEAELHHSNLKFSDALRSWDISKLFDGWIDGPGYRNRPVREFRPDLRTGLLISKLPNEADKDGGIQNLADEEGLRIAFLSACEKGLKAAEPFLKLFQGRIEEGGILISPLHVAILGKDFELCCKLVKGGADVNRALGSEAARHFDAIRKHKVSSLTGATSLHLAIAFDFENVVLKCLLNCNVLDWGARDAVGRTALHYAALYSNLPIFDALMVGHKRLQLSLCDHDSWTVLHAIAAAGNIDVFYDQLQKSTDVDFAALDGSGRTPLHVAAASGNVSSVKALLTIPGLKEVAIQQRDNSGKIPLVCAMDPIWHPEVISELLNNDWRRLQDMGEVAVTEVVQLKTPLHYAVYIASRKKARRVDLDSMLKPLLDYATNTTKEMFHLFWDESQPLYSVGKSVRVQELLAEYVNSKAAEQSETKLQAETSLQKAAKAGLVHLTRLLLAKNPDSLQEILSDAWQDKLSATSKEYANVMEAIRICDSRLVQEFTSQATDQPALDDSLGRRTLVEGLATLLLNPYTGTPLTIGIYGEWGVGKSSLLQQVDVALCTISIQQAFIRPLRDGRTTTKNGEKVTDALGKAVKELIGEDKLKLTNYDGILEYFVENYDPHHHEAHRSLALADTSGLFSERSKSSDTGGQLQQQPTTTPAVLTVWYNAWQYQSETDTVAGLAVEIIKGMESTMNTALWMSMCWNYAWTKNRQDIFLNVFFPIVLVGLLSVFLSVVLWNLPSTASILPIYRYSAVPVGFVVLWWTIFFRMYKTVQPVSAKLTSSFNQTRHECNLGYEHQVIEDIKFMMTALRKTPLPRFWSFLAKCKWIWLTFGLEDRDYVAGTHILKPALASDMRIVVLVDDLDRCGDATILKLLSVINLVLAVCGINVILGIDESMIQRALTNYKRLDGADDHELSFPKEYAQKFLQKIVQLPITLPDPTDNRMGHFLAKQMGFARKSKKQEKPPATTDEELKAVSSMAASPENDEDDDDESFQNGPLKVDQELNEMLLARYTAQECSILIRLQRLITKHDQRLPREWKRFLNYLRFASNILSKNPAMETFPGWQIELLVWVFVCWQLADLMNIIIQNWDLVEEGALEDGGADQEGPLKHGGAHKEGEITNVEGVEEGETTGPSLRAITKKFSEEKKFEEHRWKSLMPILEEYDVSMKGIQTFQDFRLNCKRRVLPWLVEGSNKNKWHNKHIKTNP